MAQGEKAKRDRARMGQCSRDIKGKTGVWNRDAKRNFEWIISKMAWEEESGLEVK